MNAEGPPPATSAAPWSMALDRVRVAGSVVVKTGATGFAVERLWRKPARSATLLAATVACGAGTVGLIASGAEAAVLPAMYFAGATFSILFTWVAATWNRTSIAVEAGVLRSRQRPIALRPTREVRARDVKDVTVRPARVSRGDGAFEVVVVTRAGAELVVCEGPAAHDLQVVADAIRDQLFGAR